VNMLVGQTDRQTDGRTPDRYITLFATRGQRKVAFSLTRERVPTRANARDGLKNLGLLDVRISGNARLLRPSFASARVQRRAIASVRKLLNKSPLLQAN